MLTFRQNKISFLQNIYPQLNPFLQDHWSYGHTFLKLWGWRGVVGQDGWGWGGFSQFTKCSYLESFFRDSLSLSDSQSLIFLPHNLRSILTHKPLGLESLNFERMSTPHHVSHDKCLMSPVTYHLSLVTCQMACVTCHLFTELLS